MVRDMPGAESSGVSVPHGQLCERSGALNHMTSDMLGEEKVTLGVRSHTIVFALSVLLVSRHPRLSTWCLSIPGLLWLCQSNCLLYHRSKNNSLISFILFADQSFILR